MVRPQTLLAYLWVACSCLATPIRAQQQNQPNPAKAPPLDQPPILNRVFPPALAVGSTTRLEFRGSGVENPVDLVSGRAGLAFRILPQEPLPPAPKPGTRPAAQPMEQPSRLAGRVEATVAPGLTEGMVELRVVTAGGVSNSRKVLLTSQPVLEEKEPNNDPESAQPLALNQVAAGVISASTDVDYFRFQGTKNQRVLGWLGTSSLDSRLPGAMELISPDNRVLAQARDRVHSDTLLDVRLPADGTYKVRVFSFGHVEGGPDAIYLLRLGDQPVVESVHPLVQPPQGGVCLIFGHGLPGGKPVPGNREGLEQARLVLIPVADEDLAQPSPLAGALLPLKTFRFTGGPVLRLPVSPDQTTEPQEPAENNAPENATRLTLPALVSARLEKPGDRDLYIFEAKKGEPVWIEVLGDRVGTGLDFVLSLKEEKDKTFQEIDDGPEPLDSRWFFNRSEDPSIRFNPPRDGTYSLVVSARDANLSGAPQRVYALRVGPPRPDFRLVTIDPAMQGGMPRLKPGTALSFLVLAERTGGLDAPIDVRVDGLPPGTEALPCRIPAGQKAAWMTLIGRQGLTDAVWTINMTGFCQTVPGGEILEHKARHAGPAYPTTQQVNNPQPTRMEEGLLVATSSTPPAVRLVPEKTAITLTQGDRATLKFTVTKPAGMTGQGQVSLIEIQNQQEAPIRVTNGNNGLVNLPADKTELEVQLDARNTAKAQVMHLVPRFSITTQEDDPDNRGRRRPVTRMENGQAVAVTLLPRRPLQPTLTNQTIRAKPGEKGSVSLRLNRQGFYGPVRLVCPEYQLDTTVPAGVDETSLELTLPEKARAGVKPLVIQATCEALPGQPVDQELRLQFNLTTPMTRNR